MTFLPMRELLDYLRANGFKTYMVSGGGVTGGKPNSFGLIVHLTDAERKYAYDRESHFGKLAKALDEAESRSWLVVDVKNDWKKVYAFEAP